LIKQSLVKDGFKICSKCSRELTLNNFHKRSDQKDLHSTQCKDCVNQDKKEYYLKIGKQFNKTNKKKINKRRRKWERNKYYNDINFRLIKILRVQLHDAIFKDYKSGHALELLGCSINYFRQHLESQFVEGMNWSNHGQGYGDKDMQEWHIDHIYPLASFDLTKPSEQRIACHWSNQQPMWAKENLEKSDKIL
jgi:hypothetical protein